ncbi:hypothetical protein KY285_010571 [Solanum tuberosum]|nr:hypothetical protein KY289_011116 [Solanum tuberosum]KAH0734864.1 hypothetical protein KY285_010571 [Solanum tuberosum]
MNHKRELLLLIKTQILDIGLGEEDKCSKLLLDKNTYDATTKENEDAAQMNTKNLTENINQGIIITNQIEGHKGINTIQAGTKDQQQKRIKSWWSGRPALNGFPIYNEGYGVELSRPVGILDSYLYEGDNASSLSKYDFLK